MAVKCLHKVGAINGKYYDFVLYLLGYYMNIMMMEQNLA